MNKNKNKSLVIVCILLIVVGVFILFKVSVWSIYRSLITDIGDMHEIIDSYKNNEDITIEEKEVSEYLEFEWFDVGNYFKQFKHEPSQTTEWNETFYQYDGDKKIGMLSVGTFESLLNGIKDNELVFFGGYDSSPRLDFSEMFYCNFNDFIKDKNRMYRKIEVHERRRDMTGTGIFSVLWDFDKLDGKGLPIGFQLLAKPFDEEKLLRAAYSYEQNSNFNQVNKPTFKGGNS